MREQRYQGPDVVLTRQYQPKVTLGQWKTFDSKGTIKHSCVTIELPWKNNQKEVSCIPEDLYDYEIVKATNKIPYPHVWIKNVVNRTGIKVHVANYVRELLGCIAPGLSHGDIDGDGIIDAKRSRDAFNELMKNIPPKGKILITSVPA